MPKDPRIKKVLVIGSGPIIIGQAAEFDYSGTQACRALKAEGIETVLLNSNPATIMTDPDVADHVYIEPMTLEVVERILDIEKPDSVLPNLGGQMGLNLSMELARSGYLDRTGIRLLACNPETIDRAEDRELFKETMEKLHQPIIPSEVVENLQDALDCADRIGYPVIVRPAFTMGGTGGGICETREKLIEIGTNGLRLSPIHQILVEKCIAGWKEIEYEVMRDHKGNVITVCNMENLDPVGIHTGDSIVVAPSQTLTNKEYQLLRDSALRLIPAALAASERLRTWPTASIRFASTTRRKTSGSTELSTSKSREPSRWDGCCKLTMRFPPCTQLYFFYGHSTTPPPGLQAKIRVSAGCQPPAGQTVLRTVLGASPPSPGCAGAPCGRPSPCTSLPLS